MHTIMQNWMNIIPPVCRKKMYWEIIPAGRPSNQYLFRALGINYWNAIWRGIWNRNWPLTFPYNNKVNFKEVLAYDALTIDHSLVRNTWDFATRHLSKTVIKPFSCPPSWWMVKPATLKTLVARAKMMGILLFGAGGAIWNLLVLHRWSCKNLSPKRDTRVSKYIHKWFRTCRLHLTGCL